MTDSSWTSTDPLEIPAGGRVAGTLRVPPSKSLTHRFFNLAFLTRSPLVVEEPLVAEDSHLFLEALRRSGFRVEVAADAVTLVPGPVPAGEIEIHCGNAGTMFRLLTAAAAVAPGTWRLDGTARLRERPVGPLIAALRPLGAEIECLEREGYPPLRIAGGTLRGGATRLDAGESSQYLSALLMAALAAPAEVEIEVTALTSRPYVDVTLAMLAGLGVRIAVEGNVYRVQPGLTLPSRLRVEGDFSAACYPAAAAALTGGTVRLTGLAPDSPQGDRGFFDLLRTMGARVEWRGDSGDVEVSGGELVALEADLSAMPDQVPTLAALAPFARGTTRITNVPHLRIKESDRLGAMATELRRLGLEVEEGADWLAIPGLWADRRPPSEPAVCEVYNDHRIAMSLALVGLRRSGVRIAQPEVVGKSYPGFWRDLSSLLQPR
jgi:3-phosphoshikimate 1-carboxyvinyltransferase